MMITTAITTRALMVPLKFSRDPIVYRKAKLRYGSLEIYRDPIVYRMASLIPIEFLIDRGLRPPPSLVSLKTLRSLSCTLR